MDPSGRSLLAFDTETTGVDVDRDRIVSIALVRRADGQDTARSWLLDPGVEIPPEATAVHGISTARARAEGEAPGPVLDAVARAIASQLRHGAALVAFNASFDVAILEAELTRHGLPTLVDRLGGPVQPVLDPLVLDRALDPDRQGRRTLGDLCEQFGVRTPAALHAADVDAVATLDLLCALFRAHPGIAERTSRVLHAWQVDAHAQWAHALNERLASTGRSLASTRWPG